MADERCIKCYGPARLGPAVEPRHRAAPIHSLNVHTPLGASISSQERAR